MTDQTKENASFYFASRYGNAVHFNDFEYKRSKSFSDLAQRSLGLNILMSETNKLVKLADS